MRGWKKVFHGNGKQKKAEVVILISETIDFKIYHIARDKDGHHVMIKSIQEGDTKLANICAPNTGASLHIRQT